MRSLFSLFIPAAMCIALTGCCAFVPCHPATSLVGAVLNSDGLPVANANVALYGTNSTTDSNGCFSMHVAAALPLTFAVTAQGYKSAEIVAKPGFYNVQTKLVPTLSPEKSQIEWVSISPAEYRSLTPCKY
ncbi:MAG: carboxypeptidase regulatory-like domain-containing protein [Rhodocyclales bacterium GT-UBC]|nr:MAG: carboxypeptidase regulatory-like domain-containing protein [Rhodocyclales bacterium GT-UBC]